MQLANPTKAVKAEIDKFTETLITDAAKQAFMELSQRVVIVGLIRYGTKFRVGIIYENRYNEANGEDL